MTAIRLVKIHLRWIYLCELKYFRGKQYIEIYVLEFLTYFVITPAPLSAFNKTSCAIARWRIFFIEMWTQTAT